MEDKLYLRLYHLALRALSVRERSSAELRTYLHKKALRTGGQEHIEPIISTLKEIGYIDDARFATWLAGSRARKLYGKRRIEQELMSFGVEKHLQEEALQGLEKPQIEKLRTLLQKRYQFPLSQKDTMRAWQFLARRGFDSSTIRAVLQTSEDYSL